MNISVNNISVNNNNRRQQINNKKSNQVSFKGVTMGPIPEYSQRFGGYSYYSYISGYTVPKGATPNYPGAFPNEHTKVYRADPFEIVPEEAYKTHDFTVRDDLRLSQIQNDYQRGTMNFAQNAMNEKLFLESKKQEAERQVDTHRYYIDQYGKRIEYANDTRQMDIKPALLEERNNHKQGLFYQRGQVDVLQDQLENAQERYSLLKQMDDAALEKKSVQEEYNKAVEHRGWMQDDIRRMPEFIDRRLQRGKEQRDSLMYALERSDKRVNDAVKKGVTGDAYKELLEKEMKSKISAQEYCVAKRNEYAKRIIDYRNMVAREKKELPEVEANIKALEQRLFFIGQKMDKIMAEISKLYKAKYPQWL